MNVAFPLQFDDKGRTAGAERDDHIRDLIEQLLFTVPGERVNRPEFGCGVGQLVFAPNSQELAAATQFLVQASLQQWLGHLIGVEKVEVNAVESKLTVEIQYIVLKNQVTKTETFTSEGPTA